MIIEIRAAEGGQDAKLLVEDQMTIYARLAIRRGLEFDVRTTPGIAILRITGATALKSSLTRQEVTVSENSSTERSGRVQTSTILWLF